MDPYIKWLVCCGRFTRAASQCRQPERHSAHLPLLMGTSHSWPTRCAYRSSCRSHNEAHHVGASGNQVCLPPLAARNHTCSSRNRGTLAGWLLHAAHEPHLRVHGNGGVAQDGLGSRGGHGQVLLGARDGVPEVVQGARILRVVHLQGACTPCCCVLALLHCTKPKYIQHAQGSQAASLTDIHAAMVPY